MYIYLLKLGYNNVTTIFITKNENDKDSAKRNKKRKKKKMLVFFSSFMRFSLLFKHN